MRNLLDKRVADMLALDLGGRPKYLHPVTQEELQEGKLTRLFDSQRLYLMRRVADLPEKLRAAGEDGVLREIVDAAMRAHFGPAYEENAKALAKAAAQQRAERDGAKRSKRPAKRSAKGKK
jgi:hypothetical protein